MYKKIFFSASFLVILLCTSKMLHAQISDFDPDFYFKNSISIQKSGMIVLGSWAGLNLLSGLGGNFYFNNESKYFFQMNAAWNVVNLGIAAIGFSGIPELSSQLSNQEMLGEMQNFDKILLINAGLDLLYIGTGSYLLNRGLKKNNHRFIGYGRSVILQGGFLLLFDLALYLIHSPNTKGLYQITENITITATGFSLAF
ncbi:MAG: hypothetical protein JJ895_01770 [Balneolaceae bacterium]|nr:hypothetical protein [Balneolaceae bacterium]